MGSKRRSEVMSKKLKIEKGIKIPLIKYERSGRKKGVGKLISLVSSMNPNDSVLFKKKHDALNTASTGKRMGFVMTTRMVDDGWRVWRIE